MSTGERRFARILPSASLLLAAAAAVSGCSRSGQEAVAATAGSTAVIQSSSAVQPSAMPDPAGTTSAASTTRATGAPKSTNSTPPKTRAPASPASASAASESPAAAPAAPVAVNGRSVPSCDPARFAQRAGIARGALETYLFAPYAAGAMRGSGTKPALALLHAGQAVRFATQELAAAKGLLATCSRPVGEVVADVGAEVATLRDLWPVFAANQAPGAAGVHGTRAAQTAVTRSAVNARMPLAAVVPTTIQIQTGN